MVRWGLGIAFLLAPLPASAAAAVPVGLEWIGNDASGGVLVAKVRQAIRDSLDKREPLGRGEGLTVIVQTLDPALEWQDGIAAQARITVYSLTINQRRSGLREETFASAALGYCAQADLATCAGEIIEAIDEQIAKRGLR